MTINNWDSLQRKAKYLEARLESKISAYAQYAQAFDSNSLSDEENPMLESREERELMSEIERDLNELSECVANMRTSTPTVTMHQFENIIKRYHEIHFDQSSEFNKISANIQRKRSSFELFRSARVQQSGQDPALARLINENNSIKSSLKGINDVIGQAFETKNSLLAQRGTLNSSAGGLSTLTSSVPMLNRLIDGIQKKKAKESAILAAVIGSLMCITIWWMFLR